MKQSSGSDYNLDGELYKTTIGGRIRQLRNAKNLSLLEFAQSIELNSAGQVSGWENNRHLPNLINAIKLKEVHGLDLIAVATGDQELFNDQFHLKEAGSVYQQQVSVTADPKMQVMIVMLGDNGEKICDYLIPKECFLQLLRINALGNKLMIFNVIGDSMVPDIEEGEKVLVLPSSSDPVKDSIRDGAMYLVKVPEAIFVRRLAQRTDDILLIPNNSLYSKSTFAKKDIVIIGRVIGKLKVMAKEI